MTVKKFFFNFLFASNIRIVTRECLIPMVVRDMEFAIRASACVVLDFPDAIVSVRSRWNC